jgi:hypothetical protein
MAISSALRACGEAGGPALRVLQALWTLSAAQPIAKIEQLQPRPQK